MQTIVKTWHIKVLLLFYLAIVFSLFLYSFTQVDLNLTLSRASWFQTIEKSFQYIGYFNRPLSTYVFIGLLIVLYGFYLVFLTLAIKNKLNRKQVWSTILIATAILVFSYNAFSYDIFNYIFDAKILSFYHQNPYLHKALDFPQDKMLHFMRWTHRTYPYGPVWLFLTVPLSFIGLQIFLPTFFLFKFLMAGSFLGTCFFIEKISQKLFPKHTLFNFVFFACNPLVLIESLVSAHFDIVMIFFAIIAVWFLINKKWFFASVVLLVSIGIKFATVFLLPVFVFVYCYKKMKHLYPSRFSLFAFSSENIFLFSSLLMVIAIVVESYWSGNFQPWYLLIALPFASFAAKKYYILIPTVIMTFFALLEYVPYLYLGDWNPPVPTILFLLTTSGIIGSILITGLWNVFSCISQKRFSTISPHPNPLRPERE